MGEAKIRLDAVSYSYPGVRAPLEALREVSFACASGEIVAVVGPSGCGKSSLLSLVAGLRAPTGGAVLLDGRPVAGPTAGIGLLFQRNTLLPWRTVKENVELGMEIRGVPGRERAARAQALIHQYGLAGFERKFPHALSGGMQKRVALIQTLAVDPQTLLLDEPFASLDAQTRLVIEDDVVKICRAGHRTALLVTHDIAEAISMADRIIVLSRRPARVKATFEIPLGRAAAKVADVPAMPEFTRYFRWVWEALEVSLPALAGDGG